MLDKDSVAKNPSILSERDELARRAHQEVFPDFFRAQAELELSEIEREAAEGGAP